MDEPIAPSPQLAPSAGGLPSPAAEPIAIVGMACRFPGHGDHPDAFWRLLRDGGNPVQEVPPDRWDVDAFYDPDPVAPGKTYCRWGSFIDSVYSFDAGFFGVAPSQAVAMDPQQRLLLETSWHALENAGIAPDRLAGTQTGVFVGMVTSNEYAAVKAAHSADYHIDSHDSTGTAASSAAGRISYVLGLHGPSMCVDTACSSSLVAVHLACQSLRTGESTTALASGVNLMLAPDTTIAYSKTRMLSRTGQCRTFDASADGYVRGEGCGVVVLKTLSSAQAAGDRILALIGGSAVNQDGRTSGLTAPNGLAQQALIQQALKQAGVSPQDVSLVEAHGTGTALGDPIEVEAIGSVLGRNRSQPCIIGSVKTNIGHLEGAAGIAGLIKTVLCLRNRTIPPHLHLRSLNPQIDAEASGVAVTTVAIPWKPSAAGRVAGVSSFGFTGTNAHVVLFEAPEGAMEISRRPAYLITCSAKSELALRSMASRYAAFLNESPGTTLADFSYTANCGRDSFPERLAVIASEPAEAAAAFTGYSGGRKTSGVFRYRVVRDAKPKIAFLFSSWLPHRSSPGGQLFEIEPAFRRAVTDCAQRIGTRGGRTLLEVLFGAESSERARDPFWSPVSLFALEYALAQTWASWGVRPDYVMGYGFGEYAAACTIGLLSLDDAMRLVVGNSELADAAAAQAYAAAASLAAYSGPMGKGLATAPKASSLTGAREETLEYLASLIPDKEIQVPFVSAREGGFVEVRDLATPDYWSRQWGEPERSANAIEMLYGTGCEVFLEIGPGTHLTQMAQRQFPTSNRVWLASLIEPDSDWRQMLETLGQLFVSGALVDFESFHKAHGGRVTSIPTYPFEHKVYKIGGGDEADEEELIEDAPRKLAPSDVLAQAIRLAPSVRREFLTERLTSIVGGMVGLPNEQLSPNQRLEELGLDSLLAIDLVFALEDALGIKLPATLITDYPTVASLTAYVMEGLNQQSFAEDGSERSENS